MKNIFWKKSNKAIKYILKNNYRLVLFFTFFWTTLISGGIYLENMSHIKGTVHWIISGCEYTLMNPHRTGSIVDGIGGFLGKYIFPSIGIIFFGIVIISYINIIIVKEISNGQIGIWLTSGFSRTNILFSKISSILLITTIVFFPSGLIISVLSAISYDASANFGYVFGEMIDFILLCYLLVFLFSMISLFLIDNNVVLNCTLSLILFYILITWLLQIIYHNNAEAYKPIIYLKYFTIQSLVPKLLNFDTLDINIVHIKSNLTWQLYINHPDKNGSVALSNILIFLFSSILILISLKLFKKQDIK